MANKMLCTVIPPKIYKVRAENCYWWVIVVSRIYFRISRRILAKLLYLAQNHQCAELTLLAINVLNLDFIDKIKLIKYYN